MMADTIRGKVTNIVDGDTFDMEVTHTGKQNTIKYNDNERIRIASVDAPEIDTYAGKQAKIKLENKFLYKEVRCTIQARDIYRRIVADVVII